MRAISGLNSPNGRDAVFEPDFFDGDGTVPLWSAETSTATTTYYVNHREGDGNSAGHGSLPANTTVQEIVRAILKDNPPKASLFPYPEQQRTSQSYTDLEPSLLSLATFNGYTTDFTLHSDAHLKVTNPAGQAVGFIEEGVVDEGISGSSFLEMESGEYASIPHAGDALHVEVNGIQDGMFTLQVDVTTPAGKQATLLYPEVPVTAGTTAVFTLPADPSVVSPPPMTVTTNGAASVGQVIPQLTIKDILKPAQAEQPELPAEAAGSSGNPPAGQSDSGSGEVPMGEIGEEANPALPAIPFPGGNKLLIGMGVIGMYLCGGLLLVFLLMLGFRISRRKSPAPPVKKPTPAPALVQAHRAQRLVVSRGTASPQSLDLTPTRILIGSDPVTCTMVLVDPQVSLQHAIVDYTAAEYVLTDLNSSTGTFINGHRIQRQALHPGDRITIGNCEMVIH